MNSERSGIGMTSARTRERLIQRLVEQGIRDPRVLDRIRNVPRHLFMDEALASRAYEDTALPIGHGQTISEPYVVARMTEAITIGGTPEKVLEIGTGCGYQTAVLSPLVGRIYSIERIEPLLDRAKERLRELGSRTSASSTVTATRAGPRRRPSTASCWRRLRMRCRRSSSTSSPRAAGSSRRSGRKAARNCCASRATATSSCASGSAS